MDGKDIRIWLEMGYQHETININETFSAIVSRGQKVCTNTKSIEMLENKPRVGMEIPLNVMKKINLWPSCMFLQRTVYCPVEEVINRLQTLIVYIFLCAFLYSHSAVIIHNNQPSACRKFGPHLF